MGGDVLDRTVLIGAHGGGWNGLAVRFRAADEYAASAIHLLTTLPGSPPNEDRYAEDRELFGFFANAVAAIESCCFAIYHVGLMAQPPFFAKPPDEVTLKATATAVANAFPGKRLAAVLAHLNGDAAWREVKQIRTSSCTKRPLRDGPYTFHSGPLLPVTKYRPPSGRASASP
jgi:hypothetical protein